MNTTELTAADAKQAKKLTCKDYIAKLEDIDRNQKEAEVQRQIKGAAGRDWADKLPALTGTTEQVSLANGYRAAYFRRAAEGNAPMDLLFELASHYTEASWWTARYAKCFALSPIVLAAEMRNEVIKKAAAVKA